MTIRNYYSSLLEISGEGRPSITIDAKIAADNLIAQQHHKALVVHRNTRAKFRRQQRLHRTFVITRKRGDE